ncbi:MAG: hypothetical protein ACN6O7_17180 [Sphingobacterium sp.]
MVNYKHKLSQTKKYLKKKNNSGLLYRKEDSHMTSIFNRKGYMMLAIAFAVCFNGAKAVEKLSGKSFASVMLYFHGDSSDPSQVQDESNWTTTPNGQDCNGDSKACAQEVDSSDLTSTGQLDPAKIQLGAQESSPSSNDYIPTRTGGSSTTPFNPINRD